MTIKALIFDVDGTLAETEEVHRRAFNDSFSEAGLAWTWDEDLYADLLRTTGGKERMEAYQCRFVTESDHLSNEEIANVHKRKTARYGELVEQGALSLLPGVGELVDEARQAGLKLAVATTTSVPNVEALCRTCWSQGPNEIFDAVAAGDQVPAKKPAPDVYNLALDRLGFNAEECVAFEDTENGVISAHAAGLAVHAIPSLYAKGQNFQLASKLWDSMPSLGALNT